MSSARCDSACGLHVLDAVNLTFVLSPDLYKAANPEDVPPVIAGSKNAILSIYRRRVYLVAVVTQDGVLVQLISVLNSVDRISRKGGMYVEYTQNV